MRELNYGQAITEALHEELARDERVYLLGEDIGLMGGVFAVTKGLQQKFGPDRVLDTPLSENLILGDAIGAAVMGLRPVAEIQFSDFITTGFSQVVDVMATHHYRSGIPLPLVVRMPYGGGFRGGPFHSRCPEPWFFSIPGLYLVSPSTPADAKGLLKSAIRDDNPVMYFEHKNLYRRIKGPVPDGDHTVPLGKADIKRPGRDITLITYGWMVHLALEAAATLEREGIEVEVLDLRSLVPMDTEAILGSFRKTNRAIILHEAPKRGGIGGEIAAILDEQAFDAKAAPVRRIAPPSVPIPFSPPLEDYYLPNLEEILRTARELMTY